jgi:hypothetical protein
VLKDLPGGAPAGLLHELGAGELGSAVDGYEKEELARGGLHRRDVDVKEADGVALELRARRLVPAHIR